MTERTRMNRLQLSNDVDGTLASGTDLDELGGSDEVFGINTETAVVLVRVATILPSVSR